MKRRATFIFGNQHRPSAESIKKMDREREGTAISNTRNPILEIMKYDFSFKTKGELFALDYLLSIKT